jgi:hypothetical protein
LILFVFCDLHCLSYQPLKGLVLAVTACWAFIHVFLVFIYFLSYLFNSFLCNIFQSFHFL